MYRDTATRDKLILPSTIMRILCHFSIPFPSSDHFSIMYAIDSTIVKCSEVQFRSWQSDSVAPSSSSGDVTLEDIMAQLQCMDACLDTLFTELY